MISGFSALTPLDTTRASGVVPSSFAFVSLMTTTAAAPSFSGHALPAVTFISPANNATNVAVGTTIQVNFNEGVQVNGNWYQIVCSISGTRTPANSLFAGNFNGTTQGTSFTINPNVDFSQGEQLCTDIVPDWRSQA